MNFGENKLCVC